MRPSPFSRPQLGQVMRTSLVRRTPDAPRRTGVGLPGLSARSAYVAWLVATPHQGRGYAGGPGPTATVGCVAGRLGVGDSRRTSIRDHAASARVAAAIGLAPTDAVAAGEVRWEGRADAALGSPEVAAADPGRRGQRRPQASGRSAPPRWSARSRSRPTSAPGSRSSTRCARAVLAVRLGELAGASAQELADTYYVALLHASGCTSNGHEAAQLYGDDIEHRAAFFLIDVDQPGRGAGLLPRARRARPAAGGTRGAARARDRQRRPAARESFATMCEVAQRFAGWLELRHGHPGRARVRLRALGRHGASRSRRRRDPAADAAPPRGARHLAVPLRRRALTRRGRSSSSARAPRTSRGSPSSRCANFDELLAGLDDTRMWEQALEIEPFPQLWIAGERVDAAFAAIAALTGLKSPWLREHSTAVAELAEAAAWRMGLPSGGRDARAARRARARPRPRRRLERDLGEARRRSASASGSGCGSTRTSRSARSRSRRRSRRSGVLAGVAPRAARRLRLPPRHARARRSTRRRGSSPPPTATRAMREARPYRPALDAAAAEAELLREADEGRLDADAVDAVLAAAGHRVAGAPARASRRADRARARGAPRARARRVEPGDRRRASASRPRPSGTTSSTSTRRPASAAGRRRRSGPSSTTSFAAGIGRSPDAARASALAAHARSGAATKEEHDDPGNDAGGGLRPLRRDLLDEGRREAQAARLEGRDGLPRPQRGGPRLGALRLGRAGLAELRVRPRGAADHAGGRPQGQAAGRRPRRQLRRRRSRTSRGHETRSAGSRGRVRFSRPRT